MMSINDLVASLGPFEWCIDTYESSIPLSRRLNGCDFLRPAVLTQHCPRIFFYCYSEAAFTARRLSALLQCYALPALHSRHVKRYDIGRPTVPRPCKQPYLCFHSTVHKTTRQGAVLHTSSVRRQGYKQVLSTGHSSALPSTGSLHAWTSGFTPERVY